MADGSAKLSVRYYEFHEPTLRRESAVKRERENLSGESHSDREEFRPEEKEDDAEDRKDFWSLQEFFICCHHIESRVQLTCREKNHSLFHKIYLIERNSSEKKYTMRERIGKAKTSEVKINSLVLILQGKNGILYFTTTLRTNSSRWKDLKEALHWKQAHVFSSRGTAYLWDFK